MNIQKTMQLLVVLLLTAFASACATSTMSKTEKTEAYNQFVESEKLEELKSITVFKFDGWSSLGTEHLIISTSVNRPYLIKLKNRCYDLEFAQTIAIHNIGSSLQAKFDAISVEKNMPQKCYIEKIYKLTKEQKKTLVKIGKEEKEEA
ncbi:MAG: hypothetical protein GY829_08300 [Gammaproteobacteria bacterium]|nr:hypothetical protein [Gammaproteobacteria bacterium]